MNLNKVMIIGNLTRDPEVRTIPSGQTVTTFSVATSLSWTDQSGQRQEKTEFHNIVAWRRLGEICGQYLRKGSKVYIEGRIQTRDWQGQDGVKRYRTEIIAENMIMLDRAGVGTAAPQTGYAPAPSAPYAGLPSTGFDPAAETPQPADDDIKVEDIPF